MNIATPRRSASALMIVLALAGCARIDYACIDGKMYWRQGTVDPWRLEDGAPSHQGYTPIPCQPAARGAL